MTLKQNSNNTPSVNIDISKISKWNWGAFFLTWIWGLFNKSYWTLLTFIPYFGVLWSFVCGYKGNEWAWKNKEWESVEQFHIIQKKWGLYSSIFVVICLTIASIIHALK